MKKRLTKSNDNKVICGVCGGIAEYFNLDATLIRFAWVIFVLFGGSGILLYIIAVMIMPKAPEYKDYRDQEPHDDRSN